MTGILRVGTWNVREAVPLAGSRGNGLPMLVDALASSQADIVALQEVTFAGDGSSDQLEAITNNSPLTYCLTYCLSPSAFYPGLRSGLALLSRTAPSAVTRAALPNPNLQQRGPGGTMTTWSKGLIAARFLHAQVPVWVAGVHGYPFHRFGRDSRELEFAPIWRSLAAAIDGLMPGPVVVSGDFNSSDRSLLIHRVGRRLQSAVDDAIRTKDAAFRAGDDVLYGAGLTPGRVTVTRTFSDHPLLLTEFTLQGDAA